MTKLGNVDQVQDSIPHDNFGGGSATWVFCTCDLSHIWVSLLFLQSCLPNLFFRVCCQICERTCTANWNYTSRSEEKVIKNGHNLCLGIRSYYFNECEAKPSAVSISQIVSIWFDMLFDKSIGLRGFQVQVHIRIRLSKRRSLAAFFLAFPAWSRDNLIVCIAR